MFLGVYFSEIWELIASNSSQNTHVFLNLVFAEVRLESLVYELKMEAKDTI